MTGEKIEPAVLVVEGEILPTPAGASRKDRHRGGSKPVNAKHKNVVWLASARVIDLTAYQRLRGEGLGAKRIGRALGTTMATAQKLMNGLHWQQNPERVRLFNKMKGGSLDEATGQPTAADLAKFGGVFTGPTQADSQGDKDLRQLVESAGVSPALLDETVRSIRLLSGAVKEGDLPEKVDTKWLQDSIDLTLGRIMTLLKDPVKLSSASFADLTRAGNMLYEKRALLRGEPTSIVRNEQRGSLDAVALLLLKEVEKRGITLDIAKGPGGYQEVQG